MVKEDGERKRPYQIPETIGGNGNKPITITEVAEKLNLNSPDPEFIYENYDLALAAIALNDRFSKLCDARKVGNYKEAEKIEKEMIEIAKTGKPSGDR